MPQEQEIRKEYEGGWGVVDICPINVLGFQTHRDYLTVDFNEDDLRTRIEALRDPTIHDDEIRRRYNVPETGDWRVEEARTALQAVRNWEVAFTKCLYRPFDVRSCYYSPLIVDRPRKELIRNVLHQDNLCLGVGRQGLAVNEAEWTLVAMSKLLVDANIFRRGGINIFPLYIYPTEAEKQFGIERKANLDLSFIKELKARVGEEPTPEDVFYYIYAVLYAPAYRIRYAEFLKRDFPRIPLPPDAETFKTGAEVGAKLAGLHLLESPTLNNTGITFPKAGTGTVEKMRAEKRYAVPTNGKPGYVRLNDTEYFGNVPPEAWAFRVGGYQPAFKWLDDRAGRTLTEDDINHYRRMLAAMRDTIPLQSAADQVFGRVLDAAGSVP